jgi:hypothetical protein
LPAPRIDREDVDGPEFGRAESRFALLEERLELILGRRRNLARTRRRKRQIGRGAALRAVAVDRFPHGDRHREAARDRLRKLGPADHAALIAQEQGFGLAALVQEGLEPRPLEPARTAKARVIGDRANQKLIGDAEAERLGTPIQDGFADKPGENLLVEAVSPGLLRRDALARLAHQLLDVGLVGGPERFGRDVDPADRRHGVAGRAPEDVVDAPDREAEDQEAEHHRDHGFSKPGPAGVADSSEHG